MDSASLKAPIMRRLDELIYEPINCLSHVLGAFLSFAGLLILLSYSWGSPLYVFSFSIYGLSSILLYSASSAMHGLKVSEQRRRLLLKLDHVGIFCLIAGSYTPVALIVLRESKPLLGWGLFALVWLLAGIGMTLKLTWLDLNHWFSTSFYIALGWLALFILGPLTQALPIGALLLLILGGLFYTIGAVIFGLQRPNFYPGVFAHHELWHVFVLLGGSSHYLMLLLYVTPK